MKLKRTAVLALSSAMLLSSNAFASSVTPTPAQGTGNALELKAAVTAESLKINVTLPTVASDTLSLDIYGGAGQGQIVCKPLVFTNTGAVDVKVKLSGYNVNDLKDDGKASGIVLSKTTFEPSAETKTDKKIYLALAATDPTTLTLADTTDDDKMAALEYKPVENAAFGTLSAAAYDASKADTITAVKDCTVATLAAVDTDDPADATTNVRAVIKLDGAINPKGTWEAGDTLNVTPIFDLEPQLKTEAKS